MCRRGKHYMTSRPRKSVIMDYMREHLEPFIDSETGEVYTTELAEFAAEHFDAHGAPPEYLIPSEYYDLAEDVADEESDA